MTDKTIIRAFIDRDTDPDGYIIPANKSNVIGRKVVALSPYCGTYGMGGPGFFGLKFDNDEWLILKLWGADGWLNVDRKPLIATKDMNGLNKHLDAILPSEREWKGIDYDKEVMTSALGLPGVITEFEFSGDHGHLMIGKTMLSIENDPFKRSLRYDGKFRIFPADEDLADAWIIASVPWVNV